MLDCTCPRLTLRKLGGTLPAMGVRERATSMKKILRLGALLAIVAAVGRFLMGRRRHGEEEV